MSASRSAKCILSGSSLPTKRPRICCRNFQTSPTFSERRRPRIASIKAADMGLVTDRRTPREILKPYTDAEKVALSKKYTPAQLRAIEAGEEAVRPEDIDRRGALRSDGGALLYLDDLSTLRTFVDRKQQFDRPMDPNYRMMSEAELGAGYDRAMARILEGYVAPDRDDPDYHDKIRPNRVDLERAMLEMSKEAGTYGILPETPPVLAPAIPRDYDPAARPGAFKKTDSELEEEEEDQRDPDGVYDRLRKETGLTLDQILDFKVKVLVKHNVTNQTRLGKVNSLYCLAIAGNGNGRLGLGQAKGQEAEGTQNLAKLAAIRNMRPIPRYEERTIFGEVEAKVSAVEVKLSSRPPGFGLRCQHNIFEMARAAGIHDLAARVPRSRNKMNTVKATYQALMNQRIPDEIARGRGKKLVDVRKVYYGGRV